jgi:hypothetical protein
MKTHITEMIDMFCNVPTYLDWFWKGRRIQADYKKVKAEWQHIGGLNAGTQQLLDFLGNHSVLPVEYASWTPTVLDDQIAKVVRTVIIDHRDILTHMIEWVRKGHEPNTDELSAVVEQIGSTTNEYGSPMTVLYILSLIYRLLQFLRDNPVLPKPDKTPMPKIEVVSERREWRF